MNAQCGGPRDVEVWCVEKDLRSHNREALEVHPMHLRLRIFDGSSVDEKVTSVIAEKAATCQRVLVILDSNHTHEYVLGELNLYTPLVSVESCCVVFDRVIVDFHDAEFVDSPCSKSIIRNLKLLNSLRQIPFL